MIPMKFCKSGIIYLTQYKDKPADVMAMPTEICDPVAYGNHEERVAAGPNEGMQISHERIMTTKEILDMAYFLKFGFDMYANYNPDEHQGPEVMGNREYQQNTAPRTRTILILKNLTRSYTLEKYLEVLYRK